MLPRESCMAMIVKVKRKSSRLEVRGKDRCRRWKEAHSPG